MHSTYPAGFCDYLAKKNNELTADCDLPCGRVGGAVNGHHQHRQTSADDLRLGYFGTCNTSIRSGQTAGGKSNAGGRFNCAFRVSTQSVLDDSPSS